MTNKKSRRKRNNQNIKYQQPPKPPTKQRKSFWKLLELLSPRGKILAIFSLILSIILAYYTFSPKLSIDSRESINPMDPFATPFTIKNESLLAIYSIEPSVFIRNIRSGTSEMSHSSIFQIVPEIPEIAPGEIATFFIPFPVKDVFSQITSADIEIIIMYRPTLLPFKLKIHKRFMTVKAQDNSLRWIPRALSEK
jgi:hypothetical protein